MDDRAEHYCRHCQLWAGNVLSIVKDHEMHCDCNPEAS
jgi:hypothetical protein